MQELENFTHEFLSDSVGGRKRKLKKGKKSKKHRVSKKMRKSRKTKKSRK